MYLWSLVGAAAGKTYLRPHVRLSERPAEPSLLWSLCAGGTAGPWRLAHTLPSPDAQCSRCRSRSRRSTTPCTRLPTRYPGKGALKPLCLCLWSDSGSLKKQGFLFFSFQFLSYLYFPYLLGAARLHSITNIRLWQRLKGCWLQRVRIEILTIVLFLFLFCFLNQGFPWQLSFNQPERGLRGARAVGESSRPPPENAGKIQPVICNLFLLHNTWWCVFKQMYS